MSLASTARNEGSQRFHKPPTRDMKVGAFSVIVKSLRRFVASSTSKPIKILTDCNAAHWAGKLGKGTFEKSLRKQILSTHSCFLQLPQTIPSEFARYLTILYYIIKMEDLSHDCSHPCYISELISEVRGQNSSPSKLLR